MKQNKVLRNKTNALRALDKLIKNYEEGKGLYINGTSCSLCVYADKFEVTKGAGHSVCPYRIPEIVKYFDFMHDEGCLNWSVNDRRVWIPRTREEIPPRLILVKQIRAFARKLPAKCFKERKEGR